MSSSGGSSSAQRRSQPGLASPAQLTVTGSPRLQAGTPLDAESAALISSITACMERAAVLAVLESPERIAQHTRIFRYVRSNGLVEGIGKTLVDLPDGRTLSLADIRARSNDPVVQVFFSTHRNARLAHLLQTRGNIVVQLPSDNHKRQAVTEFLAGYCNAKALDGRVECIETYQDPTRFEKLFLAELEETILNSFEVQSAELVPGRLSEDIPVYASEDDGLLTIFVDVRHEEVTKLERLGITSLFRVTGLRILPGVSRADPESVQPQVLRERGDKPGLPLEAQVGIVDPRQQGYSGLLAWNPAASRPSW